MKAAVWLVLICACGGSAKHASGPSEPRLQPRVQSVTFYRPRAECAQGPFEIELPVTAAKYGQQLEVLVRAPHAVELHTQILAGETELVASEGVFGPNGRTSGKADNARCLADTSQRLAAIRGSQAGAATSTTVTTTGSAPPPLPTIAVELDRVDAVIGAVSVVNIPIHTEGRIRVRLWSIEPNDLTDVAFGITHVVLWPNVSEADYDAYLARPPVVIEQPVRTVEVAPPPASRPRPARPVAPPEPPKPPQIPGGDRVRLELEARARDREAYCAVHRVDDARCWTDEHRQRIRADEQRRMHDALNRPQPSGPPPAPLAETQPPRLSVNATWRPGYWQWVDTTWMWLAGMWRVPEADIVAEQTTTAPAAPPPVQIETPPPPPVSVAVWVPGFWQWDGATWIWIAGSYQLRPSASLSWRPAAWRPRGSVHILVPGGWVRR